jgi:streptomycin 6-kinase
MWNGRGAARLLARADEHFAMLVEQAGPGTLADVADFDSAVTVLGRLSRRLAVPADLPYFGDLPHLGDLPRLSDLVAAWPEEILADSAALGHPLPRRFVDAAIATVRELGGDQPATLVHGDLHDANVLAATREPWLAVDPKGCVGDPCYDTVTVLRSARFWPLLSDRARLLRGMDLFCSAAGLDPERARRWAHLRAVRAAFWGRRHGDPDWLVEATDRLLDVLSP